MQSSLKIVILGLSITSSWGNGHATTYRGIFRELSARGHSVLFLERDVPWYAQNRDLSPTPRGVGLYTSVEDLKVRYTRHIREADFVMVGSYVPDGIEVGKWVVRTTEGFKGFYDIDTPVTLAKMEKTGIPYLSKDLIPQYDIYLSFTGGPILDRLVLHYGAKKAQAFYCSFDPENYFPKSCEQAWDMGYMGTYSGDRQPALEKLFLHPARRWAQGRFIAAGPLYPKTCGGRKMSGASTTSVRGSTGISIVRSASHSISPGRKWCARVILQASACLRPPAAARRSSATTGRESRIFSRSGRKF